MQELLIVLQRLIHIIGFKLGDYLMSRFLLLLSIILLTLTACTPIASGTTNTRTSTSIVVTVSASTAAVGTAEPVLITPLPSDYTPPPTPVLPTPTLIQTLPGGLGHTELKYRVLAEFPDFFYCYPDYYPIGRGDELGLALQRFPELQANPEEFNVILAHNNLTGLSTFSNDQKLLIYREHKKLAALHFELTANGYSFQLQVAKTEGKGELITGIIDGQGRITIQQRTPSYATCPICLAAGTLIDTPTGPIPVQNLRMGTFVWTMDRAGARVAKPVIQVGKTVVPPTHQVVHLVLDDGREVWVSPGHPTADWRSVGQLKVGDSLDGGMILSVEQVRYTGYATYDLLPAGETGFYWANGILLASTLKDIHK